MTGRTLALFALVAVGCHRNHRPCSSDLAAVIELRDGTGGLEMSLRQPPIAGSSLDLCDEKGQRIGSLTETTAPRTVTLFNAAGDAWVRLDASHPDADPTMILAAENGPRGAPLRLHASGYLVRILDSQGLPVGQIGPQAGKTVTFDHAGTPLAFTDTVENRRIVHQRDGAVEHYVLGISDERAAAAFALDAFRPAERLALARFLDTPPPR